MPKNPKHPRRKRLLELAAEPAQPIVIKAAFEDRMGERSLIRQYLLWHATTVCNARCLLCQDAIAWLEQRDAVPDGIYALLSGKARMVGGS